MNYYLFVTGCQQNIYDANKIAHLLKKMGYLESGEKKADLIIVLACSVRQKPIDRIFGKIRNWKKLPQKPKIILTGCVLNADKKKFIDRVDAIIDSKKIEKELPKILSKKLEIRNLKLEIGDKNSIFVPIMFGCNNFCSYCAVPYVRGREISRDSKEIICEIEKLVENGTSEITLLGQNVNSYKPDFVGLLNKIEKINGLEKITFLTSHPKDMGDNLIKWMGESKKFSGELHLPLQSGDNEILRAMNRHYTAADFLKLVSKIKKLNPKLKWFSTDLIVGFPGETKEQFENTVNLCKKIKFDKAFVNQYSPRSGTVSSKLKDNVSRQEKKRRWKVLDELINNSKLGEQKVGR